MNKDETTTCSGETAVAQPEARPYDSLKAENESLKLQLQLKNARDLSVEKLRSLGAHSPTLIFDAIAPSIRFDDDGAPKDLNLLIDKLLREHPEQFSAQYAPTAPDGMNVRMQTPTLTRETLSQMSAAEISKLDWDDVKRVLEGR